MPPPPMWRSTRNRPLSTSVPESIRAALSRPCRHAADRLGEAVPIDVFARQHVLHVVARLVERNFFDPLFERNVGPQFQPARHAGGAAVVRRGRIRSLASEAL